MHLRLNHAGSDFPFDIATASEAHEVMPDEAGINAKIAEFLRDIFNVHSMLLMKGSSSFCKKPINNKEAHLRVV